MLTAGGLVEQLDRNNDGRLDPTEVPRQVVFAVSPASVAAAPLPTNVAESRVDAQPGPMNAPTAGVPEWFLRMDRNGDGDVLLREFLGPIALFRELDRDGDGLLSPDEARRLK